MMVVEGRWYMWVWGWDGKDDGVINTEMEVVIMVMAAHH